MTNTNEDPQHLTEYFSGIDKGYFMKNQLKASIQIGNKNTSHVVWIYLESIYGWASIFKKLDLRTLFIFEKN